MKKIDGRGITHRIDISNDYLVIKISIAVRSVEFLVFFLSGMRGKAIYLIALCTD